MRALFAMACAVSLSACGGGRQTCCPSVGVERGVNYVGSIAASDGGVATKVRVAVGTTGGTRITFEREGVQIVESFSAR